MVRPLFYVVDSAKKLVGVITRSRLEAWMFGHATESTRSLDKATASTLGEVAREAVVADADEPLRAAIARMAQTGRTWLPVVAHHDPREIVGEITLADTLKARVRHLEEEQRRERVLPLEAILPDWLKLRQVSGLWNARGR
jgi:CBS domain-containing protein